MDVDGTPVNIPPYTYYFPYGTYWFVVNGSNSVLDYTFDNMT